jgi:cytochrome P450
MEAVREYGFPVPQRVICEMLGVPREDFALFERWSEALIEIPPGGELDEHRTRSTQAMAEVAAYVRRLLALRRGTRGDDLISRLLAAEDDGSRLNEIELVAITFELIIAGHETTAKLIPNGLYLLLTDPEQFALAWEDGHLLASAVDEILRFENSVQMALPRVALDDVELRGRTIPKGDTVAVIVGSANRDAEVFASPDEFQVRRDPNDHIGFGFGSHFCIGHALARAEVRIALERLFQRFPGVRLASDDIEWASPNMTRGVKRLPVRW